MAGQVPKSLISFDSAVVETILSKMHEDVTPATIQLRLRYLQRSDFPAGAQAGRGKRAVYDLADVLKVALAFEMLDLEATPQRAAATVEQSWPALSRCLAPAWLALRLLADEGGKDTAERVDALRRIAIAPSGALAGDDARHTVGLLRPTTFSAAIAAADGSFRGCLLIDILAVVSSLDAALQAPPLGYRRGEIDAAFERLGEAVHGGGFQSEWMPPPED